MKLCNPHSYEIGADEMSAIIWALEYVIEQAKIKKDEQILERLSPIKERLTKEFLTY